MDWTKAKNIIIAALIITNLVLIGSLYVKFNEKQEMQKRELSDTISVLESRNITINTTLPKTVGNKPLLYIEYDNADQSLIEEKLKGQVGISSEIIDQSSIEKYINVFFTECNIMTKNIVLKSIVEKNGVYSIEYKNMVGDIALEDSYIKCTFSEGKIIDFQRIWLKPLDFGKTKREVMPISSALIRFMNKIKEGPDKDSNIVINGIEFVYWLDTSALDLNSPVTDTAFPAWKFTYNNGEVIHIGAFEI
jgi:hypothetical protein